MIKMIEFRIKYLVCIVGVFLGCVIYFVIAEQRSEGNTRVGMGQSDTGGWQVGADQKENDGDESLDDVGRKKDVAQNTLALNLLRLEDLSRKQQLETSSQFALDEFQDYIRLVIHSDIDGNAKNHLVCLASARMGREGRPEDANHVIKASLGHGRLRIDAIRYLYSAVEFSYGEFKTSILSWDHAQDRSAAAFGLIGWARRGNESITIEAINSHDTPAMYRSNLLEGLLGKMGMKPSKEEKVELFSKVLNGLSPAKNARPKLVEKFIARSASFLPFESWQAWQKEFNSMPSAKYRDQMLVAMHGADVEHTLTEVMKDWPVDPKNIYAVNDFLRKVTETGLAQDSEKVMQWYDANKSNMSPEVKDGISEPIAKRLTMEKKYDEAQKWVEQLSDKGIKDRSIRGLAIFRDKETREQVRKDPQATVELLKSENHFESSILIGVAINEWLNNKPDHAGKWFFENSKSMNDAQRDSSAEAFVQYGIKVGDLEAARQWAEEHSSEEQRRKYYKQIDHAAVEQAYKEK